MPSHRQTGTIRRHWQPERTTAPPLHRNTIPIILSRAHRGLVQRAFTHHIAHGCINAQMLCAQNPNPQRKQLEYSYKSIISKNIMNLQELSVSEKILLAEDLWDSVAADEQLFPLTEAQRKELDARLANYASNPEAGDTWENVRNRISGS